jgi:heme-degrading monooxygenase HmoA
MELYIFGKFLVRDGQENTFEDALREVVTATRAEAGCAEVHGYRSVRNARLYYLHSRWKRRVPSGLWKVIGSFEWPIGFRELCFSQQ